MNIHYWLQKDHKVSSILNRHNRIHYLHQTLATHPSGKLKLERSILSLYCFPFSNPCLRFQSLDAGVCLLSELSSKVLSSSTMSSANKSQVYALLDSPLIQEWFRSRCSRAATDLSSQPNRAKKGATTKELNWHSAADLRGHQPNYFII